MCIVWDTILSRLTCDGPHESLALRSKWALTWLTKFVVESSLNRRINFAHILRRLMPTHHAFFTLSFSGRLMMVMVLQYISVLAKCFTTTICNDRHTHTRYIHLTKSVVFWEFCLLFRYTKVNKESSRRKSCTMIHFTSTSINTHAYRLLYGGNIWYTFSSSLTMAFIHFFLSFFGFTV